MECVKMNFINTWGAVLENEYVVSDIASKYNLGATVKCIAEDGDILICQNDKETVKLLKTGWVERETPDFNWNDNVKIIAKGITVRIELICWHYNEKRYFYHLIDESGKRLSKRYYVDELQKVV